MLVKHHLSCGPDAQFGKIVAAGACFIMTTASPNTALTDQQRTALDAHNRSVSLSAGAGCGKTHVLTERFLAYLDPRQLEPTAEHGSTLRHAPPRRPASYGDSIALTITPS